jgi:hypothetical protein
MPHSDPVVAKAYFKDYYQKNKLKKQIYQQENKETIKSRMKLWRVDNKDSIKLNKQLWDSENKEHILDYQRKFMAENRDTQLVLMSNRNRKRLYGLTKEQYNEMFIKQDGKCAICGKHQSELRIRLCVDHNHSNGKIRELLCSRCNLALGFLEESEQRRINILAYIQKHNKEVKS